MSERRQKLCEGGILMKAHLINQWHCDECEDIFYTDLEKEPKLCPYCKSNTLSDSKVLEVKPLSFGK